jgi:BirA family biotin operon repressor/biotin-[acetyl-CoA-carboxylase] ligase
MLCALAAADSVREVSGLAAALKWPNDLIVGGRSWRKLAGTLTEIGAVGAGMDYAVVGIGINVDVPSSLLSSLAPDATSILAETGQPVDRVAVLAALLAGAERRYEALRVGESPHAEWVARLATLGRPVKATTAEATVVGVAESVDQGGALLLRTPDGTLHRLLAGDVTLDRS